MAVRAEWGVVIPERTTVGHSLGADLVQIGLQSEPTSSLRWLSRVLGRNYGAVALLAAVGLVVVVLASTARFPESTSPDRTRALFGTWLVGVAASVGLVVLEARGHVVFGKLYRPLQVDYPGLLLISGVLVLASALAVDADLRT